MSDANLPDPDGLIANAVYIGAAINFTLDEFERFTKKYGFTQEEASQIQTVFNLQITILDALASVR